MFMSKASQIIHNRFNFYFIFLKDWLGFFMAKYLKNIFVNTNDPDYKLQMS